jgi:hypothetical protein
MVGTRLEWDKTWRVAMLIETFAIAFAATFALVALVGHGLLFKALMTRQ